MNAKKIRKTYTDAEGRKWRLVGCYHINGVKYPIYEAVTTREEREYIRSQKGLYKSVAFRAAS